jgi:hypothetical protein
MEAEVRLSILLVLLPACAVFAPADVVEHSVKDSPPSGLLAGVARADISPPVGIPQMNWGSQTHVEAAGVDPVGMRVSALVLSDGRQKFAMATVELGSASRVAAAVERAAELTGIPAGHIRIGSVHTHAGPAFQRAKGPVGVDPARYERMLREYYSVVNDKVVGALVEAHANLRPAHLGAARGAGSININRRFRARDGQPPAVGLNPAEFVDRELPVLRIDDAQGRPMAVVVNFQCHGTVLGYENKIASGDWPAAMRKTVEEAYPGAVCLFLQGAAGNQGPVEGYTGDLSVSHRLGRILGLEAATVAARIDTVRREPRLEGFVESTAQQAKQPWRVLGSNDSTVKFTAKTIELPRRVYSKEEIDSMAALVADAERQIEAAKKSGEEWKLAQAQARHRRWNDLLAKFQRPRDATPVRLDARILRIGNAAIVSVPGEMFAEIGAAVKKTSPFATTLFWGYTTGEGGGYMPTESEYRHGGYEVHMTPYGSGAAEKLIGELTAMYAAVR